MNRTMALVAAAALALGACGRGDDDVAGETTTSTAERTSTVPGGTGSDLESGGGDAASALDRDASETLSDLNAEVRSGDTVVTLPERVLFAFGQHTLLPDAARVLDDLALVVASIEDAPVRVDGHTDAVGSAEANQALSERRARAVADHLVGAGVDAGRLTARGLGEAQPVAPNTRPDGADDPAGRAQNRRVEVVIEGVDLSGDL